MRMSRIRKIGLAFVAGIAVLGPQAQTTNQDGLKVAVNTKGYSGCYSDNAAVMWITDANGKFIRTIGIWSRNYRQHLNEWAVQSVGSKDKTGDDNGIINAKKNWDGTTAASRKSHGLITGYWDLKDKSGLPVTLGKFRYSIEMTHCNASGAYAHGWITIGAQNVTRTGVDSVGTKCPTCLTDVTVIYTSSGPDKTPPSISRVSATSRKTVLITFSEPVEKISATTLSNYKITYKNATGDVNTVYPINVTNATLDLTGREVTLSTDSLYSLENYQVQASNIKDVSEFSNVATLTRADFTFQKIVTTDLTENMKMLFKGTPVGTIKSSFVTIYDDPANIGTAAVLAQIDDLDDTLEASIAINESPFYFNSGDGVSSNGLAWGSIDVSTKYVKQGNNEVKIKFNSNLKNSTNGFTVEALKFEYEIFVLRKGGGITAVSLPKTNRAFIGQSGVSFGLDSKPTIQGTIFDLSGNKIKTLPQGKVSWNMKNESGLRVHKGVYIAVFHDGPNQKFFSFTLLH